MLIIIAGVWMGLRVLSSAPKTGDAATQALADARDAVIGASMQGISATVVFGTVSSPGRLPAPDISQWEGDYDGTVDPACLTSTGGNTALGGSTINAANLRCLGRLPWQDLGLGQYAGEPVNDPRGVIPWYAVSANLVTRCRALNPGVLLTTYSAFGGTNCGSVAQPYPWLTVRDEKGNVVTNRAAAVFIIPGPALPGQTRPAAPLPTAAAYLDTVTVAAGCIAPCVPGTYNNAALNLPNATGLSFIRCAIGKVESNNPNYAQPYNCNDRIEFITIDQLMEITERRVAEYAAARLRAYFAANGFFPFAAPHDPLAASGRGECQSGLARGLIPALAETNPGGDAQRCTHPAFDALLDTWFKDNAAVNDNAWGDWIYYAVSAGCTQPGPACAAGVLAAGSRTGLRAIVIGSGAPIVAAPFAPAKGAAQVRPSANVADYLDSTVNADADNAFEAGTLPVRPDYNDRVLAVSP
ncbi:MAG: hypothetical protein JNM79_04765 [Burkholderiales bacterium]|nr:hypothetical protein [Burkholderiales bacterium]